MSESQAIWNETAVTSQTGLTRLHKFAHFWVLVWKSFERNRCPIRASALAYATLLALVPMLAVALSITSTFLKKEGEDRIDQFIVKMVASITPPAMLSTNMVAASTNVTVTVTNITEETNPMLENPWEAVVVAPIMETNITAIQQTGTVTNQTVVPDLLRTREAVEARRLVASNIKQFIDNTRSAALGLTGSLLLIFVGISMLIRVESALNDMWGVTQGRSWSRRIVLYWSVITLAPILLVVALGLASGPHWDTTRSLLHRMPFVGNLLFQLLPVVVLSLTFALIYALMPNTKVRLDAALVGGLTGGILFHVNNMLSVLYVSRVVSNSRIYGSLSLVPVLMIGLYFCWVIFLFGAQVAYAYQNRETYLEEKRVEHINQRGREFVALRLMTFIGQRFLQGASPPGTVLIGRALSIPTRLVQQVANTLCAAHLVLETNGSDCGYVPARPLERITCHDVLLALRATQGGDVATRDEGSRAEVYGEYQRIQEAERQVASSVTMLALANRALALKSDLSDAEFKALS